MFIFTVRIDKNKLNNRMAERIQVFTYERLDDLLRRDPHEFNEITLEEILKSQHVKRLLAERVKANLVNKFNDQFSFDQKRHLKRSLTCDTFDSGDAKYSKSCDEETPKVFVTNNEDLHDMFNANKLVSPINQFGDHNSLPDDIIEILSPVRENSLFFE